MYWVYTLDDLKTKTRLFLSDKQAQAAQDFQNLALVARQLFGGKSDKPTEEIEVPKNIHEMKSAFNKVFG